MIEKINPHLKGFRIILASQSPRRKELLKQFGLEFTVNALSADESFPDRLNPREAAEFVARKKGDAFPKEELTDHTIVIAADTVVAIGNEILGKPSDYDHARRMLENLSGRDHLVITAVLMKSSQKQELFSVSTRVWFKELRDEEIDYYIRKFEPYDKAGAYGIQEWIGFAAIEHIEGSYFNVVGLPVHALYQKLIEW